MTVKNQSESPVSNPSHNPKWLLKGIIGLVFVAIGLSIGIVVGNVRGNAINSTAVADAANAVEQAVEKQKLAESRMASALAAREKDVLDHARVIAERDAEIAQRDEKLAASAKTIKSLEERITTRETADDEARRKFGDSGLGQNGLVIEFIDNPEKFKGRELTARVRYGPRPSGGRLDMDLKQHVTQYGEGRGDGKRRTDIWFYGSEPARASIDLIIEVPTDLELPAARLDDELLVTFKCGTSPKTGNIATKIIRPQK